MKLAPIAATVLPASSRCVARAQCIARVKFVVLPMPMETQDALRGERAPGGGWRFISRFLSRALGRLAAARP